MPQSPVKHRPIPRCPQSRNLPLPNLPQPILLIPHHLHKIQVPGRIRPILLLKRILSLHMIRNRIRSYKRGICVFALQINAYIARDMCRRDVEDDLEELVDGVPAIEGCGAKADGHAWGF